MLLNEMYNTFNASLVPQVQPLKDKVVYQWEFKDMPMLVLEPYMPQTNQITPVILFSTFKSWRQLYDWWWQMVKDKIEVSRDIETLAEQLTRGKTTASEKVRALYDFCSQKIRYVGVEYGIGGYEPRHVQETLTNRYGDCKDKTILLISLLKAVGIDAYPVLLGGAETLKVDETFPALSFNHVICVVKLGDEYTFLDPTSETFPCGAIDPLYQGGKVLAMLKEGPKVLTIPETTYKDNKESLRLEINILPDESITGRMTKVQEGYDNYLSHYRLRYEVPKLLRDYLKEAVQRFCVGAQMTNFSIENADDIYKPVRQIVDFTGRRFLIEATDQRIIPSFVQAEDLIGFSVVALEKRNYHLDFLCPSTYAMEVEINLPYNLRVKGLPSSVKKDSAWMSFSSSYKTQGNKIVFSLEQILKGRYLLKEEYPAFKEFVKSIAQEAIDQCIVLEKSGY
jgi:hypothetical protein